MRRNIAIVCTTLFVALFAQSGRSQTCSGTTNWTEPSGNLTENCGSVGVGTTTPSFKLDSWVSDSNTGFLGSGTQIALNLVNNGAPANGWATLSFARAGGQSVSAAIAAQFTDVTTPKTELVFGTGASNGVTEKLRLTSDGYLGLGTSTAGTYGAFAIRKSASVNSKNVSASFSDAVNSTLDVRHLSGRADISSENSDLTFSTVSSGTDGVERMRITNAGNVTMTGNLTVSGSITGATVVNAVYQDIAEWVPSGTQLTPGTVVVLDPRNANQVMPSHEAYDTTVAGVVSGQPGVVLGRAADTKSKIATVGRVRVRVDATQHPVHIGDLLVTSGVAGVAMVSEPVDLGGVKIHRPGTLIGKALEPLNGVEGDVLVLLSLQ